MSKYESAKLILELFDLRREAKLRESRDWWGKFKPKSVEDIKNAVYGPDSVKYRMAAGYWDMAAALVNHGAIEEAMFFDTTGEYLFMYVKLQPFLDGIREIDPSAFVQIERLINKMPDSEKKIARIKTYIDKM